MADDAELMQLMLDANIIATFVGIESPNEASLRETKKFQNVRSGGSLLEKVHRIQDAGIEVWCGMIMGFDNDDETIFDAQIEFVREARIAHSMSGMLYAIAKTPLHARLAAEGRLDPSDQPEFGTNVIPLKLSREELRDGYVKVMNELYTPEAYFGRLEDLWIKGNFYIGTSRAKYWKKHPFQRLKMESIWLVQAIGLFIRFMTMIPEKHLREEYQRRTWRYLKHRRNPGMLLTYMLKIAQHYHAHTMATQMKSGATMVYNSY